MDTIFFYIYLILTGLSIFVFTASRCLYDMKTFDMFLYPNENFAILENYWFLSYHILVYALLGFLFGFEVKYVMILKILAFETYLYATEYCDLFQTASIHNLYIVIIIAIMSYLLGCTFNSARMMM